MKVIDLINKIANDENMPRKIIYEGDIFEYRRDLDDYEIYDEINNHYDYLLENPYGKAYSEFFNDEIEVIEEEKNIEKLPYYSLEKVQKAKNKKEWYEKIVELFEQMTNDYHKKINELTDAVNKLNKEK